MATPQEQQKLMGKIIAKTWSDPAFKQKLLANPAATLKAEGVEIPAGIEVRAVENTDTAVYMVLPSKPTGELSEQDLDQVAGGGGEFATKCFSL